MCMPDSTLAPKDKVRKSQLMDVITFFFLTADQYHRGGLDPSKNYSCGIGNKIIEYK